MKKLISMVDYVLEQGGCVYGYTDRECNEKAYLFYGKVFEYANFLKQPLKLEMFVPCDEDGNVLEEPKKYNIIFGNSIRNPLYGKQLEQYQKALSKVLFKGFYRVNNETILTMAVNGDFIEFDIEDLTIENLIKYNLELTDNK